MKIVYVDISMAGTVTCSVPDDFEMPSEDLSESKLAEKMSDYIDWHDLPNQLNVEVSEVWDMSRNTNQSVNPND